VLLPARLSGVDMDVDMDIDLEVCTGMDMDMDCDYGQARDCEPCAHGSQGRHSCCCLKELSGVDMDVDMGCREWIG